MADTETPKLDDFEAITALVRVIDSSIFWPMVAGVLFLTVLIAHIELSGKTHASNKAIANSQTFIYVTILFVGNLVAAAAFLVPFVSAFSVDGHPMFGYAVLSAIVGVFAFEFVLTNINLTFFDKDVLTIADWIGKARDAAIAASLERDIIETQRSQIKLARKLAALPAQTLNTHIGLILGNGEGAKIDAEAAANGSDASLLKALKIVGKDAKRAEGLLE